MNKFVAGFLILRHATADWPLRVQTAASQGLLDIGSLLSGLSQHVTAIGRDLRPKDPPELCDMCGTHDAITLQGAKICQKHANILLYRFPTAWAMAIEHAVNTSRISVRASSAIYAEACRLLTTVSRDAAEAYLQERGLFAPTEVFERAKNARCCRSILRALRSAVRNTAGGGPPYMFITVRDIRTRSTWPTARTVSMLEHLQELGLVRQYMSGDIYWRALSATESDPLDTGDPTDDVGADDDPRGAAETGDPT